MDDIRCRKCGHVGDPISTTEPFPTMGVRLDMDDPDYDDHRDGIDIDGYLSIGLQVCRSCHALLGFWIENCDDAVFHADWGRDREAEAKKINDRPAGD